MDVRWTDSKISGISDLTAGDPYDIYLFEPEGYNLTEFTCDGAEIAVNHKDGQVRVISLVKAESGQITWEARY